MNNRELAEKKIEDNLNLLEPSVVAFEKRKALIQKISAAISLIVFLFSFIFIKLSLDNETEQGGSISVSILVVSCLMIFLWFVYNFTNGVLTKLISHGDRDLFKVKYELEKTLGELENMLSTDDILIEKEITGLAKWEQNTVKDHKIIDIDNKVRKILTSSNLTVTFKDAVENYKILGSIQDKIISKVESIMKRLE